jgi:hypothetical protein
MNKRFRPYSICCVIVAVWLASNGCNNSKSVSGLQKAKGIDAGVAEDSGESPLAHKPASAPPAGYLFEPPIRLEAAGAPIAVDSPGYACPTMADVDGDGKQDLVVGQFSDGAMRWFRNIATASQVPELSSGEWINCDGEKAVVPGVW